LLTTFSLWCLEIQKAEVSKLLVTSKIEAFSFKALCLNELCLKSIFSFSKWSLLSHPDETEKWKTFAMNRCFLLAHYILDSTEVCVSCIP